MHARGVPTGQKFKLQAMMESISDFGNASLILGGDFNLTFEQSLDVIGGSNLDRDGPYHSTLKSYMEEWLLSDTWHELHPTDHRFTLISRRQGYIKMTRPDFFLISDNIKSTVTDAYILPSLNSDHSPVTLTISNESPNSGKGYWWLLLTDKENHTQLKKSILNTIENNKGAAPTAMWDMMKANMRGTNISYSAYKGKECKRTLEDLGRHIAREVIVRDQLTDQTNINQLQDQVLELETQLNDVYYEKIKKS